MRHGKISLVLILMSSTAVALVLLMNVSGATDYAWAAPNGEKIFQDTCAGCHIGGQNVIDPKKPIIGSKILASPKTLKSFLSKPHNPMPSFPKIANNEADLSALLAYCKTLK